MRLTIKSDTIDIAIDDNYMLMIAVLKACIDTKDNEVTAYIYDGDLTLNFLSVNLHDAIDIIAEDYE